MMKKRMHAVATLQLDRSRKCPVSSERDLKKKGWRTMEEFVDSSKNLVVVSWYDNRCVLTISNFIGKEPVEECKWYDKKQKETVYLPCPASVGLYNKFMGGVDKADMLLALCKTKCKTSKWYHRIAFHLFSLAVVNAWIVYCKIGGSGAVLPFLQQMLQYDSRWRQYWWWDTLK